MLQNDDIYTTIHIFDVSKKLMLLFSEETFGWLSKDFTLNYSKDFYIVAKIFLDLFFWTSIHQIILNIYK